MFNKKMFAILIFLLFIMTISAASAEDGSAAAISDSDEKILIDESNEMLINDGQNEKLLADDESSENIRNAGETREKILNDNNTGSFDDLAKEIENIEEGGILNLSKDYKYQSGFKEGITLNKTIIINGNNHRIDGDGQSRIFNIFKSNITLNDLILVNGYHELGGAIFSHKPLICNNILFENNHAIRGGALYIINQLNLSNCIFDGNEADFGAAIHSETNLSEEDYEEYDDEDYIDNETYSGDGNNTDPSANPDENNIDKNNIDSSSNQDENNIDSSVNLDESNNDDENSTDSEEYPDEEYTIPINFIIENSVFKNTHNTTIAIIYGASADTTKIVNCSFEDSETEYGTAIFGQSGSSAYIYNSNFTNLHASKSGGAILFTSFAQGVIENCSFINTSCNSNGGAICLGIYDIEIFENQNSLEIINCEFKNAKARYGGAITQAGGNLIIKNSLFEDNEASYTGGAMHCGCCILDISNSNFKNNKLNNTDFDSNGGAINVFTGNISIDSTNFTDNTKNALYFVDSGYNVRNSFFNGNGEAIHSAYEIYIALENNNYTEDTLSLNNSAEDIYRFVINNTGVQIELINNSIDIDNLPSRFDLRDWGWVTPVKDQGDTGACWIFATCGGLESSLLKATGVEYNFSIQNLQKNLNIFSKYGIINSTEGGYATVAADYIVSWYGPLPVEYEEFDYYGKISSPLYSNDTIHVQDFMWLSPRNVNDTNYTQLKEAIMKNGAVVSVVKMDFYTEPYYNNETAAWYSYELSDDEIIDDSEDNESYSNTGADDESYDNTGVTDESYDNPGEDDESTDEKESYTNHAICVVGWDDNYPASNFLKTPPGDGAWIIKNSYGSQNFDNGYVYLSYYDEFFSRDDRVISYIFENTENYTKNYQTDISGEIFFENKSENYSYKNSYQSIDDDFISAAGTYFNESGEEYTVEIYVNDELKHSQNGTAPYRGFHTIKLTKNIAIKKGDNFTAVMKTHSLPTVIEIFRHFDINNSFVDRGNGWEELSKENTTAVLKVYTVSEDNKKPSDRMATKIDCKNMTTTAVATEDGRIGKYFVVALKDENGTALANKAIKIGFNGKVYDRTTDENGSAKLQINLAYKGTYTFAIGFLGDNEYLGAFEVAKITVKVQSPKLTVANKSYKTSAKTKSLTATFKTASGKAVSGKKISFSLNGKTYSANTNSKGIATVKVSLNKKGTYSFTVKFAGDNTFAAVSKKAKLDLK